MEEEKGFVQIKIDGHVNNRKYGLQDVDISELQELINDFQSLIFPEVKDKRNRPKVYYIPEEGSVIHKFFTSIAAIISFTALSSEVSKRNEITFLGHKAAEVLDKFQKFSASKNYEVTISTSVVDSLPIEIKPNTNYYLPKEIYVDSEVYVYGTIFNLGGKLNPNIHLDTPENGTLMISATKEELISLENKLYSLVGIRAKGKQNVLDGHYDQLKFLSFIEYAPNATRERYIERIKRATIAWQDVADTDKWLIDLRGDRLGGPYKFHD